MRAFTAAGRQFILPNGIIVLIAVVLQRYAPFAVSPQAVETAVLVTGAAALALAWRFHLVRMALALATVILVMAGAMAALQSEPDIALCATALLAFAAPLNIAFLLLIDDSHFDLESLGWWAGVVAVEALLIFVMSRSQAVEVAHWLYAPAFNASIFSPLVSPVAIVTALAMVAVFINFVFAQKAVDCALFWAAASVALALPSVRHDGDSLHFIAAMLVLGAGVLEASYAVAYNDELTGLPGRRSYHRLVAKLRGTYSLAIVDIDHFKTFNDTYGHDIGDQVLRMVAARLAQVTGGGKAFRIGGEEFAIVFPHAYVDDAASHLELLREDIELSPFIVRGPDRSQRERPERRKSHDPRRVRTVATETRVTVSMGVAESTARVDADDVLQCADRALYRAKENGRNQVIIFSGPPQVQKRVRTRRQPVAQPEPDRFR